MRELCEGAISERSIFRLLADDGHLLFPDEMFADLYAKCGRRSVAPRTMATVMVLQRFEGLSDSEAVDRLHFDTATEVTAGNAGDASAAEVLLADILESAGVVPNVKVQPPSSRDGMFSQDDFEIDTKAGTVQCPARERVSLRVMKDGSSMAEFGACCTNCSLRPQCTQSKSGRTISLHAKHATLDRHRKLQRNEAWKTHYRKVRPRVERKLAHLVRRKHGGRCSRMRGCERIGHDFSLRAASINLARLAALGVRIAPNAMVG